MILKDMGGWKTIAMVQKYAHLNAGHLAEYAHMSEVTENLRNSELVKNGFAA